MPFSLHRPSIIKNEPVLNAMTSKGKREADAALAAQTSPATDRDAGCAPISHLRMYRDRVKALRTARTPAPASETPQEAGNAPGPDPRASFNLEQARTSMVASHLVTAGVATAGFNIPQALLLHKIEGQKPPLLCSIEHSHSTFRITDDLSGTEGCDVTGLAEMRMSGSTQFNEKELDDLFEKIQPRKLVVLDYKQEFHAFIDGKPVTWFAADNNNWGNVDKKPEDILGKEAKKLRKLPTKFNSLRLPNRDDVKKERSEPRIVEIPDLSQAKLETEKEMVERKGGIYIRIPTTDHARLSDDMVDKLVASLRDLHRKERETGVVFHRHHHCYGGMGRTTQGMVLDDMLRNANQVPCDGIVERQDKLRKRMQKPATGGNTYKQQLRNEKTAFISAFHLYAQDNPLDKEDAIPWTEWVKQKVEAVVV